MFCAAEVNRAQGLELRDDGKVVTRPDRKPARESGKDGTLSSLRRAFSLGYASLVFFVRLWTLSRS